MRIKAQTRNVAETKDFAKAFAVALKPGMIVLLSGDMGSGKTTFVKEVSKALGAKEEVTSPTFSLLNIYQAKFPIYHFDMYRLSSAEEATSLGFEEFFDPESLDGVCFVEWAENVSGLINHADFLVKITKISVTRREFEIMEGKDVGY